MQKILDSLTSSVGRKIVMGLTGLLLVGFLVEHLLGNLKLIEDPSGEAFNEYVAWIQGFGPLLIVAEIGLAALFISHIAIALKLSMENLQARKSRYVVRASHGQKTAGSTTMLVTGSLITGYLALHLLDFRFDERFFEDPATFVKSTLADPSHGLYYLLAALVIGLHLSHGFRSAFQSLGLSHTRLNPYLNKIGIGLALFFAIGFGSMPLYFMFTWEAPTQ